MSYNPSIVVSNVSKCYEMYANPKDRLRQILSHSGKKFYKEFWALRDVSLNFKEEKLLGY